jgi:hypothetical protein
MKRVFAGLLLCSAMGAWGQSSKEPYMAPRPVKPFDDSEFMQRLEKMKEENPALPKPKLGPIDKWRYESCQKEAAQAPTQFGVTTGLRLCREKFGQ